MDQNLEAKNKSKSQKPSLFFQEIPIEEEELKQKSEIKEPQDIRNDSQYAFKIKNFLPQKLHSGDQDIQISSQQIGNSSVLNESQNDTITNQSFIKSQQDAIMKVPQQQKHSLGLINFKNQGSHHSIQQQQIRISIQMSDMTQQDIEEDKPIQENSSMIKSKDIKNQSSLLQSNDIFSRNSISKSVRKYQSQKMQSQIQSSMQLDKNILIQDEIFYENNIKKLSSKLNIAIKSQYQQKQEHFRKSLYKQNLLKAADIIKRLFGSSISRVMRIRSYVRNFITLLKLRHPNRRLEDLSEEELNSINDLSHFYRYKRSFYKYSNCFKMLFFFLNITKFIPTFMPSNTIRVIWDLIQVFFIYVFLYIYSLLVFFDENYFHPQIIKKFNIITFILFLFDILANLNTAFYDKDTIITKHALIAKRYFLSSIFLTDFITLLFLGIKIFLSNKLIVENLNLSQFVFLLSTLIFSKANCIYTKKKSFDYVFTLTENQKHIFKLINQLASAITAAHIGKNQTLFTYLIFNINIAALGWYFVAIQEENSNMQNWLQKIETQNISIQEKYLYSIYWSITTMTTVGYGDISATNSTEALYISVAMILFSCVFAYTINNIGFILQEIEKSSKQLNDDISTIQRKNVSIQLKSRVRHYLSFLAQEQKDRDKIQEDKILQQLSNKLRDEISLEINAKILNSYHLFLSNFSKSTLNKLIFIMKEILVNPNEVIIRENESDDSSIYFIQNGIIEIYQQQQQKQGKINVIKTLKDGDIFGDISFFSGLNRQASARSVNLSTLYKITREEFIEVLKQNKEDFEHFKMIQDEIIFQREKQHIYNNCYYCRDSNHIANQCPRTHKLMDKQFIILKKNFSIFQERRSQPVKANKRSKSNAKQLQIVLMKIDITHNIDYLLLIDNNSKQIQKH